MVAGASHAHAHRIDLHGLTGRRVTIYGQQEAVKDMVAARLETGRPLHFEVADAAVHDIASHHAQQHLHGRRRGAGIGV